MTSQLPLWQDLLLLGLGLVGLVYVFYFRIWLALAFGADLLFAGALALAVGAVAFPDLFDGLAGRVIDWSPLPAALEEADARVEALADLPGELVASALAQIGYEPDEEAPPKESTAPTDQDLAPGPFNTHIRPSVQALVAIVLRVAALVCGGFLMLTSLATRASTLTARRLGDLAGRVEALELARRPGLEGPPDAPGGSPDGRA